MIENVKKKFLMMNTKYVYILKGSEKNQWEKEYTTQRLLHTWVDT